MERGNATKEGGLASRLTWSLMSLYLILSLLGREIAAEWRWWPSQKWLRLAGTASSHKDGTLPWAACPLEERGPDPQGGMGTGANTEGRLQL